ncbi:hypothetical protein BaRGS_00033387, partial [Batillaria attramentaria]
VQPVTSITTTIACLEEETIARDTFLTSWTVCVFLVVQSSEAAHRHHHPACLSDEDDHQTFIQRMFSDNMRRQSPEVFSVRHFLFCGTSAWDQKALQGHLEAFNTSLMTRLTRLDLGLLRFVSTDRPLVFRQSREDLASNLITLNKDLLCMVEAGDKGNSLLRRSRMDCTILRHFRTLTRAARAAIGPLGACDPEALEVDCSSWETREERRIWLMSYFVVNQAFQFLTFLNQSCVADVSTPLTMS